MPRSHLLAIAAVTALGFSAGAPARAAEAAFTPVDTPAAAVDEAELAPPARPLSARQLVRELDALLADHPATRRATVTLRVTDTETGEVLFDRGGSRLLTPASNLKIFTSAAALDAFGPEHRFQTRLKFGKLAEPLTVDETAESGAAPARPARAPLAARDRVLVLEGGGDPMFRIPDLRAMVAQVVESHGAAALANRAVAIDNRRFPVPRFGPGWMWDDAGDTYNMPISAAMLDFNAVTVRVRPTPPRSAEAEARAESRPEAAPAGTDPAAAASPIRRPHVETLPDAGPALPIRNRGRVIPADTPADDRVPLRLTRRPGDDTATLTGDLPADSEPVILGVTPEDPGRWVGQVLVSLFAEHGIPVGPVVRLSADQFASAELNTVSTHRGPAMAAILEHFNHESENAVGELLLLHLGELAVNDALTTPAERERRRAAEKEREDRRLEAAAAATEAGTSVAEAPAEDPAETFKAQLPVKLPTAWDAGAESISTWLALSAGIEPDAFRLVDGSGLSRYNLLSGEANTQLLEIMLRHPDAETFVAALPTWPVRVSPDDAETPVLEERVTGKSGGMTGVYTLAGYLDTVRGRRLVFSFMANGIRGPRAEIRDLRDAVWARLARYRH